MTNSILLPSEEETNINIIIEGQDTVTVDLLKLDELFGEADKKAREMQTKWEDEFPQLFKNKYNVTINRVQAFFLNVRHKTLMMEIKKKLSEGLPVSINTDGGSNQKRNGKSKESKKRSRRSKPKKSSEKSSNRK